MSRFFLAVLLVLSLVFTVGGAYAAVPEPWGLGLQEAASPTAEKIADFHDLLLIIITSITLFVLFLMIYVGVRFRASKNPNPSKTSHNTLIEIIWTAVPVLILVVIAIPSFRLLYFMDKVEEPDMTLKVTGYQWYWGYEYPDHGDIAFDSYMIPDDKIDESKGQKRLLEVDNRVVLPVGQDIRVLLTAGDVLHSWAIPALGVKKDTVPGRLNETWVRINREGVYYGQCSEICGPGHAFMPVAIEAVSPERFAEWVKEQGGTMPEEVLPGEEDLPQQSSLESEVQPVGTRQNVAGDVGQEVPAAFAMGGVVYTQASSQQASSQALPQPFYQGASMLPPSSH